MHKNDYLLAYCLISIHIINQPVTTLNNLVVLSIDEVATIFLGLDTSVATISPKCPRMMHKHSPSSSNDHIRAVLSNDPVNALKIHLQL